MARMSSFVFVACAAAAKHYDQDLGLKLAYLEKAVYCGADRFNRWDVGDALVYGPRVDASRVRFVYDNATQSAAGVGSMAEPDGCFVAVQGTRGTTESILDGVFVTDRFERDSCDNCWVHSGWHSCYKAIKADVFGALEAFGCQGRPLYLTAHSLGAAVLHYLLYDALEAGYDVPSAFAMEAPRPGDKHFAAALQSKSQNVSAYRIVHYKDIVPHVPPTFVANYQHALPEIYYTNETGTAYKECGEEDPNCSLQWNLLQCTPNDHTWYADINPCSCSNSTHTPPAVFLGMQV